jgi:hypothetical protein
VLFVSSFLNLLFFLVEFKFDFGSVQDKSGFKSPAVFLFAFLDFGFLAEQQQFCVFHRHAGAGRFLPYPESAAFFLVIRAVVVEPVSKSVSLKLALAVSRPTGYETCFFYRLRFQNLTF